MNDSMNYFNVLREEDSYYSTSDEESDNYSSYFNFMKKDNKDKFGLNEVDILYKFFIDKGLNFDYGNLTWRINKEHIYASLRRNAGDINKSGKELEEMVEKKDFEIREFYMKDREENSTKPYLSKQEWQIKPKSGMYLLYNNKVYVINYVSFSDGYFTLDRVITREYNSVTYNFTDDDVKYGKFKQINEDETKVNLQKEYKYICEKLEVAYQIRNKHLFSLFEEYEKCKRQIYEINNYHINNCTTNAKLQEIGKFDLPIATIKKITEYGIYTECDHMRRISYLQDDMEKLDYYIEEDDEEYKELKWKKDVAYHILRGDYEEWLDYDFW